MLNYFQEKEDPPKFPSHYSDIFFFQQKNNYSDICICNIVLICFLHYELNESVNDIGKLCYRVEQHRSKPLQNFIKKNENQ